MSSTYDDLTPLSSADIADKGISPLPDVPELSSSELKAKFDEIPTTILMPKINELVQRANELLAEVLDLASIAEIQGLVTAEEIQTWNNAADYPYSPNLLHNADWGYSLVNQRGHTGAVSSAMCIDRWYGNGSVTPSVGSHVTLSTGTTIEQRMEIIPAALAGKAVTFAYEDNSGTVHSVGTAFPASISDLSTSETCGDLTIKADFRTGSYVLGGVTCNAIPYLHITANAAVNVRRVWLELGRVCHMENTPPADFGTNLAICQRYYLRITVTNGAPFGQMFSSTAATTNGTVVIPLTVQMRKSPTLVITHPSENPDYAIGTSDMAAITSFGTVTQDLYGLRFTVNFSSRTIGRGLYMITQAGDIFEFGAEL